MFDKWAFDVKEEQMIKKDAETVIHILINTDPDIHNLLREFCYHFPRHEDEVRRQYYDAFDLDWDEAIMSEKG